MGVCEFGGEEEDLKKEGCRALEWIEMKGRRVVGWGELFDGILIVMLMVILTVTANERL